MKVQQKCPADFPLGRRLGLLSRLYYGALLKKFEQLEIDRHFSVLLILDSEKGNCSQQYISDLLGTDKTIMVRMIDYLARGGFIKRVDDPADRRAYHIRLTAKGKKLVPKIRKGMQELNNTSFKGLSKKETENFYRAMDIMYENLIQQPSHPVKEALKRPRK
jgi:DNA-binding MarR family transcriptional regulator